MDTGAEEKWFFFFFKLLRSSQHYKYTILFSDIYLQQKDRQKETVGVGAKCVSDEVLLWYTFSWPGI